MSISADRGGATSQTWYQEGIPVTLEMPDGKLKLRFSLDSKGGGRTDIQINLDSDSYESVLAGMLECDFDRTVRAFAKCLSSRNSRARARRASERR